MTCSTAGKLETYFGQIRASILIVQLEIHFLFRIRMVGYFVPIFSKPPIGEMDIDQTIRHKNRDIEVESCLDLERRAGKRNQNMSPLP